MSDADGDLRLALAKSNVALHDLAGAAQIMLIACQNGKVRFGKGKLAQIAAALETSATVTMQNARVLAATGGQDG